MADRRRGSRYVLTNPLPADVLPMQDATVEEFSGDRLVVIAGSQPAVDESLIVHVTTDDGVVSRPARVISSNPVSVAGSVQFRVEMRLHPLRDRPRQEPAS